VYKLLIRVGGVQTKIEVTPVLRGSVYEPELRAVPALWRKHLDSRKCAWCLLRISTPERSLLLWTVNIRVTCLIYGTFSQMRESTKLYAVPSSSINRPMFEVLAPKRKSIQAEFRRGFQGMTAEPVAIEELTNARKSLIDAGVRDIPAAHRRFLLSFERGTPDWSLLELPCAADLPAVR
jgi:hypothetical protein